MIIRIPILLKIEHKSDSGTIQPTSYNGCAGVEDVILIEATKWHLEWQNGSTIFLKLELILVVVFTVF